MKSIQRNEAFGHDVRLLSGGKDLVETTLRLWTNGSTGQDYWTRGILTETVDPLLDSWLRSGQRAYQHIR